MSKLPDGTASSPDTVAADKLLGSIYRVDDQCALKSQIIVKNNKNLFKMIIWLHELSMRIRLHGHAAAGHRIQGRVRELPVWEFSPDSMTWRSGSGVRKTLCRQELR
jgi:hypothetical protein